MAFAGVWEADGAGGGASLLAPAQGRPRSGSGSLPSLVKLSGQPDSEVLRGRLFTDAPSMMVAPSPSPMTSPPTSPLRRMAAEEHQLAPMASPSPKRSPREKRKFMPKLFSRSAEADLAATRSHMGSPSSDGNNIPLPTRAGVRGLWPGKRGESKLSKRSHSGSSLGSGGRASPQADRRIVVEYAVSLQILTPAVSGEPAELPRQVRVVRGATGVGFTLHGSRPVVIRAVERGSPASKAGLLPGDVLLSIDGQPCDNIGHQDVIGLMKKALSIPWPKKDIASLDELLRRNTSSFDGKADNIRNPLFREHELARQRFNSAVSPRAASASPRVPSPAGRSKSTTTSASTPSPPRVASPIMPDSPARTISPPIISVEHMATMGEVYPDVDLHDTPSPSWDAAEGSPQKKRARPKPQQALSTVVVDDNQQWMPEMHSDEEDEPQSAGDKQKSKKFVHKETVVEALASGSGVKALLSDDAALFEKVHQMNERALSHGASSAGHPSVQVVDVPDAQPEQPQDNSVIASLFAELDKYAEPVKQIQAEPRENDDPSAGPKFMRKTRRAYQPANGGDTAQHAQPMAPIPRLPAATNLPVTSTTTAPTVEAGEEDTRHVIVIGPDPNANYDTESDDSSIDSDDSDTDASGFYGFGGGPSESREPQQPQQTQQPTDVPPVPLDQPGLYDHSATAGPLLSEPPPSEQQHIPLVRAATHSGPAPPSSIAGARGRKIRSSLKRPNQAGSSPRQRTKSVTFKLELVEMPNGVFPAEREVPPSVQQTWGVALKSPTAKSAAGKHTQPAPPPQADVTPSLNWRDQVDDSAHQSVALSALAMFESRTKSKTTAVHAAQPPQDIPGSSMQQPPAQGLEETQQQQQPQLPQHQQPAEDAEAEQHNPPQARARSGIEKANGNGNDYDSSSDSDGDGGSHDRGVPLHSVVAHAAAPNTSTPQKVADSRRPPDRVLSFELSPEELHSLTAESLVDDQRQQQRQAAASLEKDPDTTSGFDFKFNQVDGPVNRTSCTGLYGVFGGVPASPLANTGIAGKGKLLRWGPNHYRHAIVSRWARGCDGTVAERHNKSILEVILARHKPSGKWLVPDTVEGAANPMLTTLQSAAKKLASARPEVHDKVLELLSAGQTFDAQALENDTRNTDNAWVETCPVSYHDPDQNFALFPSAFEEGEYEFKWVLYHRSLRGIPTIHELIAPVARALGSYAGKMRPVVDHSFSLLECDDDSEEDPEEYVRAHPIEMLHRLDRRSSVSALVGVMNRRASVVEGTDEKLTQSVMLARMNSFTKPAPSTQSSRTRISSQTPDAPSAGATTESAALDTSASAGVGNIFARLEIEETASPKEPQWLLDLRQRRKTKDQQTQQTGDAQPAEYADMPEWKRAVLLRKQKQQEEQRVTEAEKAKPQLRSSVLGRFNVST
eukprot:m.177672 g.177672  ORF g.177672 m.177672 type:complete len:1413 (-) comp17969_c0_seq3:3876-8114(-)